MSIGIIILVICIAIPILFGTWVYFAIGGDKSSRKMYSAPKGDKHLSKARPPYNFSSLETKSQEQQTQSQEQQTQSQTQTSHPQTQTHQSQLARFHFVADEKCASKKDYRDEDSVLESVAIRGKNKSSLETKSQEQQTQSQTQTSHPQTETHQSQLERFHFVVGEKYVSKKDYCDEDSVLECVAMRGKNKRMVAFFDYGRLEIGRDERSDIERADWFSLKMDGDVEVCKRGKIRADNIASPQQVQKYAQQARDDQTAWRTYWANRKAEKERVAKLERIAKEHGIEV